MGFSAVEPGVPTLICIFLNTAGLPCATFGQKRKSVIKEPDAPVIDQISPWCRESTAMAVKLNRKIDDGLTVRLAPLEREMRKPLDKLQGFGAIFWRRGSIPD